MMATSPTTFQTQNTMATILAFLGFLDDLPSRELTYIAPEKWGLGNDPFLFDNPIFRGVLLLVSGRVK